MNGITCFGEIVYDRFPDEERLGGAPLNVSYHLRQMGVPIVFCSAVGNDERGKKAKEYLYENQLHMHVATVVNLPTGTVDVEMKEDLSHTFTINEGCAWEEITEFPHPSKVLVFGSLAMKSQTNRHSFFQWIMMQPKWILCDLNIREPFFTPKVADWCLKRANALKINDSELKVLRKLYRLSGSDEYALEELAREFNLKAIALTMGPEGIKLWMNDRWHFRPADPISEMVDTVGAGDSFTSIFTRGLFEDQSPEWILEKGAKLAARICSIRGALPEDKQVYEI